MRVTFVLLFAVSCVLARESLKIDWREVAWTDHQIYLFGETVSGGLKVNSYNRVQGKASYTNFGNYGSASLSFSGRLGTEDFGLACDDLSFKVVGVGTEQSLDLNLSANVDCYLYLGSEQIGWWENYNLVV